MSPQMLGGRLKIGREDDNAASNYKEGRIH